MPAKKKLKGKVVIPFELYGNKGLKKYEIGDTFETTNPKSIEVLTNQGKIK